MTVAEVQQRVWLRRAAVLGAGVMGRTIAAHLANTGIPTVMLDLGDLAHKAHQSLRRIDPAPLFLPDLDRLIEPGSLENDLARAAEADWIIEAIIEDLPTKQGLLPPLLPFFPLRTVQLMLEFGRSVEEVDELTGPLLGRPRTATFRLLDLAGLDAALAVAEHAYQNLPHDESREAFRPPAPLQEMVRRGWIGEKKGGGFYRRVDGEIQALDLSTMDYRPRRKASFPWVETTMTLEGPDTRLRAVTSAKDKDGRLLYFDCTTAAYRPVPDRSGVIVLADQKRAGKAVVSTPDATIVDLGDGVACVGFHGQFNIITEGTVP